MKYKLANKEKPYQYRKGIAGMVIPLALQGGKLIYDAIDSGIRNKNAKKEMERLQGERPNNYVSPKLLEIKKEADERARIYREQLQQTLANATSAMRYDPRQAANVGNIVEAGRRGMQGIAAQQAQENMMGDRLIAQDNARVQAQNQQLWKDQVGWVQGERAGARQQLQGSLVDFGMGVASAAGQGLFDNWFNGSGGGNTDLPGMDGPMGDVSYSDVSQQPNNFNPLLPGPNNNPSGPGNSGGMNASAGYLSGQPAGYGYLNYPQVNGNGYQAPLVPGYQPTLVPGYNPSQNMMNIANQVWDAWPNTPQWQAGPIRQDRPMVRNYQDGGMMPQPGRPMETPGEFDHGKNPLHVTADNGTKVAELTGGELVFNQEDTQEIMRLVDKGNRRELFNFVRRLLNQFTKEQE